MSDIVEMYYIRCSLIGEAEECKMLKDMIRQLASSAESMKLVMGGQVQLAGVSTEEQRALLGELKDKDNGARYFGYGWN
ncbi:hypothetical protein PAT3040_02683 [Paenibacillus agaridevorans]|uniref:Uncharacterized protein n=2 Tax=Paenibacillus TaxID=44249 RepID=A0A2R5EN50_9BACL|nr:hypothetical protein PAT3040_02683 [Paenibacillus agaridevorans]